MRTKSATTKMETHLMAFRTGANIEVYIAAPTGVPHGPTHKISKDVHHREYEYRFVGDAPIKESIENVKQSRGDWLCLPNRPLPIMTCSLDTLPIACCNYDRFCC